MEEASEALADMVAWVGAEASAEASAVGVTVEAVDGISNAGMGCGW